MLLGVEMDWLPRPHRRRSPRSSTARPFDVVLGSVHLHRRPGDRRPRPPPTATGSPAAERLDGATSSSSPRPPASGLFDVMSHPDLPKVFGARMPARARRRARRRGRRDRRDRRGHRVLVRRAAQAGRASSTRSRALLARFRRAGVPVDALERRPRPAGRRPRLRRRPSPRCAGAGYETITRFSRREPSQVSAAMGMRIGLRHRRPPLRARASADARHDRRRPPRGPGRPLGRRRRGPRASATRCWRRPGEPDIGALFPSGDAGVGGRVRRPDARGGPRARPRRRAAPWSTPTPSSCASGRALAPHRAAMEAALTGILGAPARSTPPPRTGSGALGRGEGVACHAVALLETA